MNTKTSVLDELDGQPQIPAAVDRLLLHATLAAGYAFLGFFGWLLTL
jgi:hypothetical protein